MNSKMPTLLERIRSANAGATPNLMRMGFEASPEEWRDLEALAKAGEFAKADSREDRTNSGDRTMLDLITLDQAMQWTRYLRAHIHGAIIARVQAGIPMDRNVEIRGSLFEFSALLKLADMPMASAVDAPKPLSLTAVVTSDADSPDAIAATIQELLNTMSDLRPDMAKRLRSLMLRVATLTTVTITHHANT